MNIAQAIRAAKDRARSSVSYHVSAGNVTRPDRCERCNLIGPVDGHHEDYTRPLDVAWLCKSCHNAEHRPEVAKEPKAKVTLTIHPGLWLEFRSTAVSRGVSASAEIEQYMRAQLDKWAKEKR